MDGEVTKHESFGMLQINRVSGGSASLFGSSIPHSNTIRLSIHPAEVRRNLHQDWYYGETNAIIEVEMSPTQFAEAITNMNTSGTPVTIRRLNSKSMEPCPFVHKRDEFSKEFAKDMQRVAERLSILEELANGLLHMKAPAKHDREHLLQEVKRVRQDIASNMPFVLKQFNEQMDKTVLEAKGEFEASVLHTIHRLGLQALKAEDFKLLAAESTPTEEEE